MKLKEKFFKLIIKTKPKFYKITIEEEDFKKLKNKNLYNIEKKHHLITFEIGFFAYLFLKNKKLIIKKENCYHKNWLNNPIKIIFSLILVLVIFILFTLNQFFIREISFLDSRYYNEMVYQYVFKNTKKIGPYYLLNNSITNLSKELREKFYEYAYIGLSKKGSHLLIEIHYQNISQKDNLNENLIGEFISNYDATIKYINITSGNVVVKYQDVVKKGNLLVTSNLTNDFIYSKNNLVPLKGNIIGHIKEYKTIKIPKMVKIERYTGNKIKNYEINFLSKTLNLHQNTFDLYYLYVCEIFNFLNIKIKKNIYYQKQSYNILLTLEEALKFANYTVYEEFNNSIVDQKEKIISIKNLNLIENDSEYIFTFFIEMDKCISVFKNF